ncbi:MAG: hypothetical protein WBD31_31600, partial [Rubripirellula sp.]
LATLLRPYGLESLGLLLCVFAVGGMLFTLLRNPVKFFRNPARRKHIRMNRLMISGVVAAGLIWLSFYPLPSGVSVDARIVPHQETPIYVATAGSLQSLEKRPGDWVESGEVIAQLENSDIELAFTKVKGKHATQLATVQTMQLAAIDNPDVANELPAQQSLLDDLASQLATHQSRHDGLTIKSTASGKLIAAPRRPDDRKAVLANHLVSWSGYPTDPENTNCYLETGHELMSVLQGDGWDAEIVLQQDEVERISIGAAVKLAMESDPSRTFTGTVTEIARTEWEEHQNSQRRDDVQAARSQSPLATSYMVRIELNLTDQIPALTGSLATARIEATKTSLASRTTRWLSSLLRFR